MTVAPDPIPVYVGDDWSFAFTYREGGNGAPVDLTGCIIAGLLFPDIRQGAIQLDPGLGLAGPIGAGSQGKLGLGLTREQTEALRPDLTSRLHVRILAGGLIHTAGVFPLLVLSLGELAPGPAQARVATDPVSGRTLTFDGVATGYPTPGVGPLTNFSEVLALPSDRSLVGVGRPYLAGEMIAVRKD